MKAMGEACTPFFSGFLAQFFYKDVMQQMTRHNYMNAKLKAESH